MICRSGLRQKSRSAFDEGLLAKSTTKYFTIISRMIFSDQERASLHSPVTDRVEATERELDSRTSS